ncbi:LptF/LptG family permease [Candidatus Sumerlaeota bacterium]|nr:LptF/LptG family permease [Candidatus Sumerlaeota bacterium]
MKIIDRYLLRNFWMTFLIILLATYCILLITEIFSNVGEMMANNTTLGTAATYFWYAMPYKLLKVAPIAVMLAVLFSLGMLARNQELLAFLASGVSAYRIAAPLLVSGLAISMVMIGLNESVVHEFQQRAKRLDRIWIAGKKAGGQFSDVARKGEGARFFVVSEYDSTQDEMTTATIITLNPETFRFQRALFMPRAKWEGRDQETGRDRWMAYKPTERIFDAQGDLIAFHELASDDGSPYYELELEPGFNELLRADRKPDEMNAINLLRYIRNKERINEPVNHYWTDFWMRIFFPFACLVMIINGIPYAMRAQSGRTMLAGFGLGILCVMLYYVATAVMLAMAEEGLIWSWTASGLPLLLFTAAGLHQIKRCAFSH